MGSGTALAADSADDLAVARAFVEARRSRHALTRYPGARPQTLAAAYAIQDAALSLWDEPIGGWKVGRINSPLDAQLGIDRLAGPVLSKSIIDVEPERAAVMTVIDGGFAAGEAELMIRLAPPADDAPLPADDQATLAWIDAVRIGIEIAASPYPGINADGPCVTISDHGNNLGLILGSSVPVTAWSGLRDIEIESFVDAQPVGRASAHTMLDGPLGAVRFLLGHLAGRGIAPQAGWWISTGAVTGVHPLTPGESFRAVFHGIGEVACRVEV